MITVYTIAYNEELMLPHFINHYRALFPGCVIVVYDNESTDNTREIAADMYCEVRTFKTGNTLSDRTYLEIKNNCWRNAGTDWVLVCDVDEHLYITERELIFEESKGTTIVRAEGFNMVSDDDNKIYRPTDILKGIRATSYDKLYLFNKRYIADINYLYGCHRANPKGKIKYSSDAYQCRHYKYLNLPYMIRRHAEFAKRMSDHNRQHGLGVHYLYSPQEITKEFNDARKKAITI